MQRISSSSFDSEDNESSIYHSAYSEYGTEAEIQEINEILDDHNYHGDVSSSFNTTTVDEDDVYVAVGKGNSSMDALSWALKYAAKSTGFVYLIHVFPKVHLIPTPLGVFPKEQLSNSQVTSYVIQERAKRREMLQKYTRLCQNSRVKHETFLIDNDQLLNGLMDSISVFHIRKLVVGMSKENLRKRKKGSNIAAQIQKNAPPDCDVKIIYEGQEVTTPFSDAGPEERINANWQVKNTPEDAVLCRCFPG